MLSLSLSLSLFSAPFPASAQEATPEAPAAGPADAPWIPAWQHGAMSRDLEALKDRAARLDGERNFTESASAWRELAGKAASEYGARDPRAIAATLRMVRALSETGGGPGGDAGSARKAAEAAAGVFGPGHAEAIFGAETAVALGAKDDLAAAERDFSAIAELSASSLGPRHPQTLSARRFLAEVTVLRGDPAGGARAWGELADECAASFAAGCLDVLSLANNIAYYLKGAGDVFGARDILRKAVSLADSALGPDHPASLLAACNLGNVLSNTGELAEAKALLSRAVASQERLLGRGHEDTLTSLNNLAEVLSALGENAEATELLREVLDAQKKAKGPESMVALITANNLASTLSALGEFREAREILEGSLEAIARALGEAHPETLGFANNLAVLMAEMGDYGGARELLERTLAAQEREMPEGHPLILRTRGNLAAALSASGDHAAALAVARKALSETEAKLGPAHPLTLHALGYLAGALSDLGDFAEARETYRRVAEARAGSLPTGHPDLLAALVNLSRMTGAAGDLEGEREILARALSDALSALGPSHSVTLSIKHNLAYCIAKLGDRDAAAELYRQVIAAREAVLGPEHPDTLGSRQNLAAIMAQGGAGAPTARMLAGVLESANRTSGPDGELASQAAANLGKAFAIQGETAAGVFFLKVSVASSQKARAGLATLERSLRKSYLATVEDRYRDLFDLLISEGRTVEALAVLSLLKEEELGGLDPASWTDAAAGEAPGGEAAGGAWAGAGEPDLFRGTRDESAWRGYRPAASLSASLGTEMAGMDRLRLKGGLSTAEEGRLATLGSEIAAAKAGFEAMCLKIPETLAGSGETPDPGSWASLHVAGRQAALSAMGKGAALVYAVSAKERLHLVTLAGGEIRHRSSEVSREELAKLAGEFRALVGDRHKDPLPAAKRLDELLIRPVEADLKALGASVLMLSLDGELRYAPMAALWDGEKWLAERYATALFTESTPLRLNDPRRSGAASASALGVTRAWPPFPALPGVAAEIAAVVKGPSAPDGALDGEAKLDREFDRAALAAGLASDAPVVHVASHFRLDPESLDNTVLLLGDGATVSLRELSSGGDMDFKGLDLLTLSACDTASASRGGEGREVESLGETVQRAGASAVLATLMPVDDGSSPDLMREFYRLRYSEGKDKAEALRGAQLSVMRSEGAAADPGGQGARGTALSAAGVSGQGASAKGAAGLGAEAGAAGPRWEGNGFSHPYYWSPFVLMGAWK
jgi:CHAT domain-containing protein/tetratricopeptide (TPR) repeat protein